MIRFIATWCSRWQYRWKNEKEGGLNHWMGKVQEKKAAEMRKQITQLTADADARDARIKQMAEMEERGYWTCENGHESTMAAPETQLPTCKECGKPAKFIKRELMSGQEKYESDKERKESENLLEAARKDIAAHEEQAKTHE